MKRFAAILFAALAVFTPIKLQNDFTFCHAEAPKKVYLTFDDGPSGDVTPKVLDILRSEGVRANFFVVGKCCREFPQILKRIYGEGHTVGAHCYEHNYRKIYRGTDAFKGDMEKCLQTLKTVIPHYRVRYMRFPGGSFGLGNEYFEAARELKLKSVDWNCINGDAQKVKDSRGAAETAAKTSAGKKRAVLLMHDNKSVTAQSLRDIIKYFKSQNYVFCVF